MDFKKLAIYALEFILSPTYFFADYKKSKQLSNQLKLGPLIKKFNTIYLIIALLIALALYLYPPTEFYKKGLGDAFIILAFFIIWAYPLSRANEIIYAFYRDAIEKLNGEPSRSDLKYGERIQLSLKSYLELIINFASIYIITSAIFCLQNQLILRRPILQWRYNYDTWIWGHITNSCNLSTPFDL